MSISDCPDCRVLAAYRDRLIAERRALERAARAVLEQRPKGNGLWKQQHLQRLLVAMAALHETLDELTQGSSCDADPSN